MKKLRDEKIKNYIFKNKFDGRFMLDVIDNPDYSYLPSVKTATYKEPVITDVPSDYYVSFIKDVKRLKTPDCECVVEVCSILQPYSQFLYGFNERGSDNIEKKYHYVKMVYTIGSKEYLDFVEAMSLHIHSVAKKSFALNDLYDVCEVVELSYATEDSVGSFSYRRPLYTEDAYLDEVIDELYNALQNNHCQDDTVNMSFERNEKIKCYDYKIKVGKNGSLKDNTGFMYKAYKKRKIPSGYYKSVIASADLYEADDGNETEVIYEVEPYEQYFNRMNNIKKDGYKDKYYYFTEYFNKEKSSNDFCKSMMISLYDEIKPFSLYDVGDIHEVLELKYDDDKDEVMVVTRRPLYYEDSLSDKKLNELVSNVR